MTVRVRSERAVRGLWRTSIVARFTGIWRILAPNAKIRSMHANASAWWVAAVLAALLVWNLASVRLTRLRRRLGIRARQRRAQRGERNAVRLLARRGYEVEAAQVTHGYQLWCDGESHAVQVRADYLVYQGGRRYLAEVKTGAEAPRLTSAATRRQLLEYAHAYDVDGILLVDMEEGRVRTVTFPSPHGAQPRALGWLLALAVGCLLGFALDGVMSAPG